MTKVLRQLLVCMDQGGAHGPITLERRLGHRDFGQLSGGCDRWPSRFEQVEPARYRVVQVGNGAACRELVVAHSARRIAHDHMADPPFTSAQNVCYQRIGRAAAGGGWPLIDELVAKPVSNVEYTRE